MGNQIKKKAGELSDSQVLEVVSDSTRQQLKNHKTKVRVTSYNNKRYSKKNPENLLWFTNGFDLLQYAIVVRPFIMKKYNIKRVVELEMLLYLFPIQYFTSKDFNLLPTRQYSYNLKTLIDMGYIVNCIERNSHGNHVYTLSETAVKIVREYYQYLSGEKVINPDSYTNPFRGVEAKKVDRQREKLMLKLKEQAENWPKLFRNNFFS